MKKLLLISLATLTLSACVQEGSRTLPIQKVESAARPYAGVRVPVRAGHLVLNDASVTVGLTGMPPEQALLGQAFLKHFDVEIRRDEMVLRQRP